MTQDHERLPQHQESESRPPLLGRRMARFNLLVTNLLTLRFAGRLPGFGIVIHTGRRSGRTYRTPVLLFRSPNGYVIALTYGRHSQWVQNVLTAGGCRLITRGRELCANQPEVFRDPRRSSVPGLVRFMLTMLRVEDFLILQVVPDDT